MISPSVSFLFQRSREGVLQLRMLETKSSLLKLLRKNASTGKQCLVGHPAKRQPESERRSRQQGGPMQCSRQRPCKFSIRHRLRCNDVDRPGKCFVLQDEENGPDHVLKRDPAHPLPSAAQLAAEPKPENGQHFGQCSAV